MTPPKKRATSLRRISANSKPIWNWRVGEVVRRAYSSLCVFRPRLVRSLAGDLTTPPLQQSGLFSMTVSLFVIESYQKLSPDAVDQAAVLFDRVSRLVGIPAGPLSPEPLSSSPPLGLVPGSFEPSSSVGRAITLWLLSLSLNITCVLWILWQQWWRQSIDHYPQGGEPHARARVRAGQFSRVGSLAMERMVEVIWVLLRASILLFLVGLGDFIFLINTTVHWVLLGYLSLLALLYAARMLITYCRFPITSLNSA
jgi:Family of unknown function (DUF6535)